VRVERRAHAFEGKVAAAQTHLGVSPDFGAGLDSAESILGLAVFGPRRGFPCQ
jgi:hypothetical protein